MDDPNDVKPEDWDNEVTFYVYDLDCFCDDVNGNPRNTIPNGNCVRLYCIW